MSGNWKTVRVFISSTFRDMHAERDHLVKVVFPRLRQWCGERRLHLVDIDLRWGVTKDEADNGKALEICLQEIDGSRPFFLCLLGDRYGWVPDELPPEEMYQFHGLQSQTHLSITHLEIQHAALAPIARTDGQEKPVCQQSFFYFRKSGCVPTADAVPESYRDEHRRTFFESLPERSAMLDDLKLSIRKHYADAHRVFDYAATWDTDAENPEDDRLHGRLTALAAFGQRVEADIQRGIREQFSEHLAALAEPVDPVEEERAQHAAFVENRTRVHVPRLGVEQAVSDYVWGTSERPLVLSGPPGSGKSAILAHWLTQNVELDQNTWLAKRDGATLVVARFIGASSASTNLARLLAGICEELRRRLELTEIIAEEVEVGPGQKEKRTRTQSMEVPADPIEVMRKWPKFLAAAAERGRVLLLIDAVNQLDRLADPASAFWIPHRLPPGIRLVISVLDHGEKSWPEYQPAADEPADWLRQLRRTKLASASDQTELAVPELDDASRQQIIRDLPSVFCKTLEPRFVDQLLQNAATRNPLFLLVALEELRVFGSFDKLPQRIAQLPQADDPQRIDEALDAIFGQVLDRLDADVRRQEKQLRALPAEEGLVTALFRLLASAHEGLSEAELAYLLAQRFKDIDQDPRDGALQFVLRQVRPYLMWKAHPQGLLVDFYHRSFWKAVRSKYLYDASERQAVHGNLAEYFASQKWFLEPLEAQRARCKPPYSPRPVHLRKIVELPAQRMVLCREAAIGKSAEELEPAYQALEQLFTDLSFLEAKNEAGRVFELTNDYRRAIDILPNNRTQRRVLMLLDEALRREIHFISRHCRNYPQALFQCFWNHAWWYDCPEASQHYVDGHAPGENKGLNLHRLLERWRSEKDLTKPQFFWVRTLRPPSVHLGTALQAVFRGHEKSVESVAFFPNGKRIASGSNDKTVRVWDANTGIETNVLRGHESGVTSIALSPDGARIVSGGSWDKKVRVWDALTGDGLHILYGHHGRIGCVAFSPIGSKIASGYGDNTVRLWDAESGAELALLRGHKDSVDSVAFSPDGRRIVSGSADNTVRLWDAESGAELALLRGHESGVTSVAFSPNGAQIASASWDKTLRVWDARTGVELRVLRGHTHAVASVAFSPDGSRLASGSGPLGGDSDKVVLVWDLQMVAESCALRGDKEEVTRMVFSPDGARLVSASRDGVVRVWDALKGAELSVFRERGVGMECVAFSPDGASIADGTCDGRVRLWDASTGALVLGLRGHKGGVISVAFSPNGKKIASLSSDETVRLWDVFSGAELHVLHGASHTVVGVTFSPDSTHVIGQSDVKAVLVWDAQTGKVKQSTDNSTPFAGALGESAYRAFSCHQEAVVEQTVDKRPVAYFVESFVPSGSLVRTDSILIHPSGHRWAASIANHIYLLQLDGAIEAE